MQRNEKIIFFRTFVYSLTGCSVVFERDWPLDYQKKLFPYRLKKGRQTGDR